MYCLKKRKRKQTNRQEKRITKRGKRQKKKGDTGEGKVSVNLNKH